ncbi:MAG: hypothetical protein OXB88_08570, partial [Bacteriovoracales bacterium]|nr:hypothetical protein [Bacteriovoracales bacterium]
STASSLPCDVQEARLSRSSLPPTNLIRVENSYLAFITVFARGASSYPKRGRSELPRAKTGSKFSKKKR